MYFNEQNKNLNKIIILLMKIELIKENKNADKRSLFVAKLAKNQFHLEKSKLEQNFLWSKIYL